jgi:hypothetical protein
MVTTTNLIRTLTIRAKTEGVPESSAQMQGLAASGNEVTRAFSSTEKATISVERAYQRLQSQLDATFKAQESLAKVTKTLEQAQAQGLATQERVNQLQALAVQQYGKMIPAASAMTKAMSESSMAAQQNAAAMEKMARGMSEAGKAAVAARAAFTDVIAGMSSIGAAALQSSVATEKMSKGMSDAGRAAVTASTAFAEMVKGMSSVGRGALEASQATEKMTKGMSDAGKAAAPAGAAFTDMIKGMSSIGKSTLESSRASEQMIKGMSGVSRAASSTGQSLDQMAKRSTLARFELINLSRQVQDVVVSLVSGQNPFTVFVQQGSQIADISQTSGVGLAGMARSLAGMIGPLGLVAAGITLVVGVSALALNAWKNMALELDNLSKFTGIAGKELQGLQRAAEIKGVKFEDWTKGIKDFSEQVTLGQKNLGTLNDLLRHNGETIDKDVVVNLMKVADLIARAKDEQEKLQILQEAGLPKTQEFVRLMEQGGDGVKKVAEGLQGAKIDDELIRKARELDELWNKIWVVGKTFAIDALTNIIGLFSSIIDKAKTLINAFVEGGKALLSLATTGGLPAGLSAAEKEAAFFADTGGKAPLKLGVSPTALGPALPPGKPIVTAQDIQAMEKELSLLRDRAKVLGDNTDAALKESIAQKELDILRAKGVKFTEEEAAAYIAASLAEKDHSKKIKELKEDYKEIESAITSFGNTLITSMLSGATATEALGKAMEGLGKQLINIGLTDFSKSISKQISALLPGLGSILGGAFGGLATAGIGIGVSLIGKLFSGDNEEAKKQQDELKKAKEAWAGMTGELTKFNNAATGVQIGDLTKSLEQLQQQMETLGRAAFKAEDFAAVAKLSATFTAFRFTSATKFVNEDLPNFISSLNTAGTLSNAAVKGVRDFGDSVQGVFTDIQTAGGALAELGGDGNLFPQVLALTQAARKAALGMIEVNEPLTDMAKQIADLRAKASALPKVLMDLGMNAADAATVIDEQLNASLKKLADTFLNDLVRQINSLAKGDWINEAEDLAKKVDQMRRDAAELGISTSLISTFFVLSAQKIVDESQLVGDRFLALQRMLGLAGTGLHEFKEAVEDTADAIKRSTEEIKRAIESNEDRLFNSLHRTDSLADELARFDLAAKREREAEIRAGGEALASLERALAQERLNIINDFFAKEAEAAKNAADAAAAEAKRARDAEIEATKRAEEEKARILKEAQDFLDGALRNIQDFITGFLSSAESTLPPSQQMAVAQQAFASQLAKAQAGDRDALTGITQNAQDVIDSVRRYLGSTAAGQSIINQMLAQLQGLPGQLSAEQFIVEGVTEAIESSTTAITTATTVQTDALSILLNQLKLATGSGDPQAIAIALLPLFNTLDTSVNGLLDLNEFMTGLRGMATDSALRDMFTRLDTDQSGSLSQLELIKIATQGTTTGLIPIDKDGKDANNLLQTTADRIAAGTAETSLWLSQIWSLLNRIYDNISTSNSWLAWLGQIAAWAPGSSHAMGGAITGGIPGRDSVRGLLTPGEFVIREPVARHNAWLAEFNRTGLVPGHAANDNTIASSIVKLERSMMRGIAALIEAQFEAAGITAKPLHEANKLNRTRRGEKKKVA